MGCDILSEMCRLAAADVARLRPDLIRGGQESFDGGTKRPTPKRAVYFHERYLERRADILAAAKQRTARKHARQAYEQDLRERRAATARKAYWANRDAILARVKTDAGREANRQAARRYRSRLKAKRSETKT